MKLLSRLSFEEFLFLPTKIRLLLILISQFIIAIFFGIYFDFFDKTQANDLNKKLLTTSTELLAQQNYTEIYAIKPLPKKINYGLTTQPITITLASTYDGFLQFLKKLKRLSIVFNIRDLTIQPNHHSDSASNNISFNLTLDIYTNDLHY